MAALPIVKIPPPPAPTAKLERCGVRYRLTGECRPPNKGEHYCASPSGYINEAFSEKDTYLNLWICVPVTPAPEYPTEVVNLAATSGLKIRSGPHDWTEMVIKHGDTQKVILRIPRSKMVHVCKLHTNKPTYPHAEVWLVEPVVKPTEQPQPSTESRIFPPLPNLVSLDFSGYTLWGYGEPKVGDRYLSRHDATPLLHEQGEQIDEIPGFGRNRWLLKKKGT